MADPSSPLDTPHGGDSDPSAVALSNTVAISENRKIASRSVGIKPSFKLLIGLTLLTALLLMPFVFSEAYLEMLRAASYELHPLMRGEGYKQGTGCLALAFTLIETLLTVRKRSRTWPIRLKMPGSIQFWRSLHIFLGVGLVATVLLHTLGSRGLNFNAVFLWVFFGVTLTALTGVVAETGLLESTRHRFGRFPGSNKPLTKGPLIRGLRSIWLISHIFLVCVFTVMLMLHMVLAYYFQ